MQQELTATVRSVGDSDARDGSNVAEVHGPPGFFFFAIGVCAGLVGVATRGHPVQGTGRLAIPSRTRLQEQKIVTSLGGLLGQVRYGGIRRSSASPRPPCDGTPSASVWPSSRQTPCPSCPYPSDRPPSGHRPGRRQVRHAHILQVDLSSH